MATTEIPANLSRLIQAGLTPAQFEQTLNCEKQPYRVLADTFEASIDDIRALANRWGITRQQAKWQPN